MLLLLGKKPFLQISALFQQLFVPSLSSTCSCSPVARQVRDLTLCFCSLWVPSSLQSACCRAVWFGADPSTARAGWDVTAVPPVPSHCHRSLRPREKQKATACPVPSTGSLAYSAKWHRMLLKPKQSSFECLRVSSTLGGKKMALFPCLRRATAAHRGQKHGQKCQHALRVCTLFSPGAGCREREHRQINIAAGTSPPEGKVNLERLSQIKACELELLAGKRREIFASALTLASVQASWVSKVSAASCVSPLGWNWVRVQLVLGQERRGSGRGQ